MLEVRTYHKESEQNSGHLNVKDVFGADFSTVFNNTEPCNYLTFDGKGINLIDEGLKFYDYFDYTGFTVPYLSDNEGEISQGADILTVGVSGALNCYPERITIQFKDACCREITISYLDAEYTVIKKEFINVTGKFATITPLRDYYTVRIGFTKSTLPYQYVRIESIIYGTINVFNKFKSHNLLEEINVLSDDLPINQFEASFVNPDGLPLTKKDALAVFSNNKYYGSFYITNVQRSAKFLYDVTAQNALSILDNTPYMGWDRGAEAVAIVENLTKYTGVNINSDGIYTSSIIDGDFKEPTCREILTGLGFAHGRMIDSSRSDSISTKYIPNQISSIILTSDRRIIGDAIFECKDEISSATIEYTCMNIKDETKSITINVTKGYENLYKFDKPVFLYSDSISNSTITYNDMYSVKFIPEAHSVTITYQECDYSITNETVHNENSSVPNVKNFNQLKVMGQALDSSGDYWDYYLISRAADVEKFIKSRGIVKAKIRLRNERVGDLIQIETAWDGIITGIITKMNITFGYEDIAEIEVLEWPL